MPCESFSGAFLRKVEGRRSNSRWSFAYLHHSHVCFPFDGINSLKGTLYAADDESGLESSCLHGLAGYLKKQLQNIVNWVVEGRAKL